MRPYQCLGAGRIVVVVIGIQHPYAKCFFKNKLRKLARLNTAMLYEASREVET